MKLCRFKVPKGKFVISWNGDRGRDIYLNVGEDRMKYAHWADDEQYTCSYQSDHIQIEIDLIECGADEIEVEGNVDRFYISSVGFRKSKAKKVIVPVKGMRSQFEVDHRRNKDFCAPTSCANMIEHLTGQQVDIVKLASECYDSKHAIYGNWPLAVAATCSYIKEWFWGQVVLKPTWEEMLGVLEDGGGVILSVRGKLTGAPKEYLEGHLMMVHGIDLVERKVYVIDSASLDVYKVYDINELGYSLRAAIFFIRH